MIVLISGLILHSLFLQTNNAQLIPTTFDVYFLCGVFPFQFYSSKACNEDTYLCSNKGEYLGFTCTDSEQCSMIYQRSSCIDGYCCKVPVVTTTTTARPPQPYICSNKGEYLGMRCQSSSQCTQIYEYSSCIDGYCCKVPVITTTTPPIPVIPKCGLYEESMGRCYAGGRCSGGYFCTAENACCRCPTGSTIGQCMNGICPNGYRCHSNGFCCLYDVFTQFPCISKRCPIGYTCAANEYCYVSRK